jgi:hypothetical protein
LKEARDELLTVPALLQTLRKISVSTSPDTKFCFFIDGLDEYDGRPADIIELVDILKSFKNVKTCVSSRPWNEFKDHFGTESPWKLFMEDLTRGDIRLYVEDTLGKNSKFQQLQKDDPQCPNFVQNIVRDADGVFLWVFLVIRSILDGLTNSDRIKDLQDRMNETPKDLKNYFKTILFSTENRYRTQTARLFTVAVNADTSLPLMAYWVIDQENPKTMFECPVEKPSTETLKFRLENMKRRLKVLSKGLIEPINTFTSNPPTVDEFLFNFPVRFLHRTVKDYLQTPDAQSMLRSWSNDDFNVDWEICTAISALAKMAPRASFSPSGKIWDQLTVFFIIHGAYVDKNPLLRADLASILDHLQAALAPAIEENKAVIYEAMTQNSEESIVFKGKDGMDIDLAVLSACVCLGILNYAADKFAKDPQLCNRLVNHVSTLYWSVQRFNKDVFPDSAQEHADMSMIEFLLNHGADPNSGFGGLTEWRMIMESFMGNDDGEDRKRLKSFEMLKLLLQYGADFEQECTHTSIGKKRVAKANELLKEWYDANQFALLEDVVKRRAGKVKKGQKITKKMRYLKLWISSKK